MNPDMVAINASSDTLSGRLSGVPYTAQKITVDAVTSNNQDIATIVILIANLLALLANQPEQCPKRLTPVYGVRLIHQTGQQIAINVGAIADQSHRWTP
jgi:hypothetical protein